MCGVMAKRVDGWERRGMIDTSSGPGKILKQRAGMMARMNAGMYSRKGLPVPKSLAPYIQKTPT